MKKILSILFSALMLLEPLAVFADTPAADTPSTTTALTETFTVQFALKKGFCHSKDGQAVLEVSDEENIYTKIIDIGNDTNSQAVTFYVNPFKEGTSFKIVPVSGVEKLYYKDNVYDSSNPLSITPSLSKESLVIEYMPAEQNGIDIVLNCNTLDFSVTSRYIGEHVIVPIDEMAKALELGYTFENGVHKVASLATTITVDAENNTYIGAKLQELPIAPQEISGKLFVPISLFASAFNLTLVLDQTGEKPILNVGTGPYVMVVDNNSYVNKKGLSSQTDYLVWVSKSEYKVRVYLGSKGNWSEINSFTCAIGAPRTPTCEGTYRYYQAQSMWDYGSYYVGPIMRFNGGYAIHSTLIYKNGTPKDNRVGMKLSLGCVRLRPADINWMAYYIPLYTTIHITG